jgi:hypothetical protein
VGLSVKPESPKTVRISGQDISAISTNYHASQYQNLTFPEMAIMVMLSVPGNTAIEQWDEHIPFLSMERQRLCLPAVLHHKSIDEKGSYWLCPARL